MPGKRAHPVRREAARKRTCQAPRRAAHPTEFGKDYFGLDQSQVRLYTALAGHIMLTIAALAVTAAQAHPSTPRPVLPTSSDDHPPDDTGLIAFTINEIERLFLLLNRKIHDTAHHLHRSEWKGRHQARVRWFHHRALASDEKHPQPDQHKCGCPTRAMPLGQT